MSKKLIISMKDQVAVLPIKFEQDKGKDDGKRFLSNDKLLKVLVSATIAFDSEGYKSGDTVFFRADIYNTPGFRQILKYGETDFVLLPNHLIVGKEVEIK